MLSPTQIAPLARRRLLTAGAAGAAITLVGCGKDEEKRKNNKAVAEVTYVTGFNITGQDSFVFAAIEHGWYAEAGLKVTVVPGVGTRGNLQYLKTGKAHFA